MADEIRHGGMRQGALRGDDIFYLEEDGMIQIIEGYCERFSGGDKK